MPKKEMTEDEIKTEVRLYALEMRRLQSAAALHLQGGDPQRTLAAARKQATAGTHRKTFPELTPTESDIYSAELENAVSRLLEMQAEILGIIDEAIIASAKVTRFLFFAVRCCGAP